MICDRYKCIFIHVRKNAGSSIIRSFGYKPKDREWNLFNEGTLGQEWNLYRERYHDYLVFTVVRNPWDRFVSGWKYLADYKHLSLDEVIANLPREGHDYRHLTRPQLDVLVDKEGRFVPDVVLRFETLEHDFKNLCKQLGKPFDLPKVNTTGHNSLKEFTSQYQIDFIRRHFKKDVDFFSYEFEKS